MLVLKSCFPRYEFKSDTICRKNKKKKEKEVTEVASKVLEEKQSTATSTTSTLQKTDAELKFEEAQRQRVSHSPCEYTHHV